MLQTCPDCGKEYSTIAKNCPNCGRPNQKFLDMTSDYLDRKGKREFADCTVHESLFQMKLGLVLLVVTIGLTFLLIQIGFAPTQLESQSFLEFLANPQDWMSFYTSFFIVFYLAICIWFCGGLFSGFLAFVLLFVGASYIGSMLPQIFQGITLVAFVLFPFYLMFIRPIMMLAKAGYFKSKSKKVVESESDRFIRQMQEFDL